MTEMYPEGRFRDWDNPDNMPYGIWYLGDGREILFDRGYSAIVGRLITADGNYVFRTKPRHHENVREQWFRDDLDHNPKAKGEKGEAAQKRCKTILIEFLMGRDVADFIIS